MMWLQIFCFFIWFYYQMWENALWRRHSRRIHIILSERVFLAYRRSHRPEIIVGIPMAHHNVSYRWSDRELRSFEVQEWIYDGAWKLAADLAPSGGIHSCTSESHNLRMETSGRYRITQRFYSFLSSIRNVCISVHGQLVACALYNKNIFVHLA